MSNKGRGEAAAFAHSRGSRCGSWKPVHVLTRTTVCLLFLTHQAAQQALERAECGVGGAFQRAQGWMGSSPKFCRSRVALGKCDKDGIEGTGGTTCFGGSLATA